MHLTINQTIRARPMRNPLMAGHEMMARRAAVDPTGPVRRVLGHVRRHLERPEGLDELARVIATAPVRSTAGRPGRTAPRSAGTTPAARRPPARGWLGADGREVPGLPGRCSYTSPPAAGHRHACAPPGEGLRAS